MAAQNNLTLLEAPWFNPETTFQSNIRPSVLAFPNLESQTLSTGNCSKLISITGLDIDSRGRLWVLDSSHIDNKCPAKIIVFDLQRKHEVII